jgi:2-polyprenyl-3-methyl-5-hydroxy-6-metoxy-1,4-benzoquinol methylase
MNLSTTALNIPDRLQLLSEGSIIMDAFSASNCLHKVTGGMEQWAKESKTEAENKVSCDWYHGTWQYLRLLNMVAVPDWYPFYMEAIKKVLEVKPGGKIMISACADFGMLAKLHEAIKEAPCNPLIDVYDICPSPLKSAQWYAQKNDLPINSFVCTDILFGTIPEEGYDLIVTDEFLSVIKDELKPMVIKKWEKLLKPGGYIITTAMEGDITTTEKRDSYAQKARKKILENLHLFEAFLAERNLEKLFMQTDRFAALHTRHMIQNRDQLLDLFSGFRLDLLEIVETPGECVNPTFSYQIVAKKPDLQYK